MGRILAVVLVVVPAVAHADGPLVAIGTLGGGAGNLRSPDFEMEGTRQTRPGIGAAIDVGYRVHAAVALGVHLGIAHYFHYDAAGSVAFPNQGISYEPIQFALSSQIAITDRVWVAPYFGVEDGELGNDVHSSYRGILGGVAAGFDLSSSGHEHWAAFVGLSGSQDNHVDHPPGQASFITAHVGAAYRYW